MSSYDDRIIFNGHDLSALCMCRMHRPIMAPVNVTSEAVGGRHGEQFHRAKMDAYEIPVELWIRSTDRRKVAELRHELASMLWTDEPVPLVLPDDPDRYHLAVVTGATDLAAITSKLPHTTVSFRVCDPIAYGAERSVSLTAGTQKSIEVGGTWETLPTVTSTLAGGTWRVTNVTTGEYVEVNATSWGAEIASGGTLVCDMANELVTINNNYAGVAVASDFFALDGSVTLLVTGASATTVDWRERWL